jgi:hypothetical protein
MARLDSEIGDVVHTGDDVPLFPDNLGIPTAVKAKVKADRKTNCYVAMHRGL